MFRFFFCKMKLFWSDNLNSMCLQWNWNTIPFHNVYNINWLVLNEWPAAAAYTKECMNNHSTEFDEILTNFFFYYSLSLDWCCFFFFSKKKLVHNTYIWNISHVCYSGTSFCILLSRKQLNHSHYTFIFRRARFHFMYCFTD